MPRISYYPIEKLADPALRGYLEHAARYGTPRPESQAIRAHVPAVLRDFWFQWERAFRNGVCDHKIKELCRVYISRTVECLYCGGQRSVRGGQQGLEEGHYDELLEFESSGRYDERQKAALAYATAIAWNPEDADEELWERLRMHFNDEEIVELGYFTAVTYGQQCWIRTLDIGHHEVLPGTNEGLADDQIRAEVG